MPSINPSNPLIVWVHLPKKTSVYCPMKRYPDIPSEFAQDIAKRIRDAAEMRTVTRLNSIAKEMRAQSDSGIPLIKQIVQMAEDFDLDGIQKLADD